MTIFIYLKICIYMSWLFILSSFFILPETINKTDDIGQHEETDDDQPIQDNGKQIECFNAKIHTLDVSSVAKQSIIV